MAELESKAPVGSSAKISGGRLTIARAAATRCRCPPDNSLGYFWSWDAIPNNSANSFTFAVISLAGLCSNVNGTAIFSWTVKLSKRKYSWKIKPRLFLRKSAACVWFNFWIFVRPIVIFPLVGVSIVERTFSRVVFPEPEAPIMPKNSPSFTSKETPSNPGFGWFA